MAIPITIEKLLTENVVEWARIEFKEGWNPDTTLKTISAFANDIDNWGGGYIVIGAKEKDGKLVRPVTGIAPDAVDRIQKDLLRYCKYLKPVYIPQSEPVYFDGNYFFWYGVLVDTKDRTHVLRNQIQRTAKRYTISGSYPVQ